MVKHVEGSAQGLGNIKMSLNWKPAQRIAYSIQLHPEEPESIFQDVLSSLSKSYCQSVVNNFVLGSST